MAIGDIKSFAITSDGWNALVTVDSLGVGGVYSPNFGLGLKNDPSTAEIVATITAPGYSNAAVLGTINLTAYGIPCAVPATGAMRQAYPNQTLPQESVSGSDVVIKIALSMNMYSVDTATVSFAAGWYTQGGHASLAVTNLPVTNNSTNTYAKSRSLGNWATAQCETIIGTSGYFEWIGGHSSARNGHPLACVVFSATDGTHTVTQTVTDMVISPDAGFVPIIVYPFSPDFTSFNDNSICTVSAKEYPWRGDATSILDTNDGVYSFPTGLYTNLQFRLDKVGDHGYICVDPVNGNNSTGTVYASQALAEASGNADLTIASALTKLQAYHNTHSGHNDCGGGFILHKGGTLLSNTGNGGNNLQWVTLKPATGVSKAAAIFQADGTNATAIYRLKIDGLTFSGAGNFLGGSGTKSIYMKNCALNLTNAAGIMNSTPYSIAHNCTGTVGANHFKGYSTNNVTWGLMRGNNFDAKYYCIANVVIGNRNVGVTARSTTAAGSTPFNDNLVYMYNFGATSAIDYWFSLGLVTDNIVMGILFAQNMFIRYSSAVDAIGTISDGGVSTSNNVLLWNNIFAGARENFAYNDLGTGGAVAHTNWSIKNNIFDNYNSKTDTFGSNPNAIGNWPVQYNVNSSGNFYRSTMTNAWLGMFYGLYSNAGTHETPLQPGYVDDQSLSGGNTSGGDYHLRSDSPCLNLAHELLIPYDFSGAQRSVIDSPGVYANVLRIGETDSGIGDDNISVKASFSLSDSGFGTDFDEKAKIIGGSGVSSFAY